ncbi:MAG: hypothetical protein Tsb0018_09580 [Opitutales bacterium]|tara:strand:- start:568 stop:897 length:330 start_codon:yes stop_codon:yes gene_type:complete
MNDSADTFDREQAQEGVEALLRASYDLLSQKESLLEDINKIQHWVTRSQGDIEKLMPSSQYSEQDRSMFLDELEGFIEEGLRWEAEHAYDDTSASKSTPSRKQRPFRVL